MENSNIVGISAEDDKVDEGGVHCGDHGIKSGTAGAGEVVGEGNVILGSRTHHLDESGKKVDGFNDERIGHDDSVLLLPMFIMTVFCKRRRKKIRMKQQLMDVDQTGHITSAEPIKMSMRRKMKLW